MASEQRLDLAGIGVPRAGLEEFVGQSDGFLQVIIDLPGTSFQIMKNVGNTRTKLAELIVERLAFSRERRGRHHLRRLDSRAGFGFTDTGNPVHDALARLRAGAFILAVNRHPCGRLAGLQQPQAGE